MPAHVRKGDEVVITAGEFKGKTGKVLSVDPDAQRVVVKGPAIRGIVKTLRPSKLNPKGGQVEIDRDFHISNVSPAVGGKPTRVRFVIKPDGAKVRVAARDGSELSVVRTADRAKKHPAKASSKAAVAKAPKGEKPARPTKPAPRKKSAAGA